MKKLIIAAMLVKAINVYSQDSTAYTPLTYKTYTSFPAYPLYSIDSSRFSSASIPEKKKSTVLIYFSPTCGHCQHQAEEITGHMKDLKDARFLMVSAYPLSEIKQFAESYGIGHFSNITLAYDPESKMRQFYEIKSLPVIFVYDKKGKLKKVFETNVKAEELIKAIEE